MPRLLKRMPYRNVFDSKIIIFFSVYQLDYNYVLTIIAFQPYPQIDDPSVLTVFVSQFERDSLL